MNAVRMNYLHLFHENVVFLCFSPSICHSLRPTPQPFIVILHITPTSCNSLCFPSLLTPLHTFCPLHFFRNRNGGIERRWKCRSVERGREEKKLRRSEKGRGKSQAVEHANDLNKYNIDSSWRILSFGINFWQPSPHSTLHSTLAPPSPHLHQTSPTISPFTSPFHSHPSTSTYFTPFLHLCPL